MGGLRRQELQCYESVEFLVDGLVHNAHSTLTKFALDLVVQNPLDPCGEERANGARPLSRSCASVVIGGNNLPVRASEPQKCRISCFSGKAHGKPSELR